MNTNKASFFRAGNRYPVLVHSLKNHNVRVGDFYLAMLENEEALKINQPLHDQ
jgi:hypothetical protein